jgi:hypothetical protein
MLHWLTGLSSDFSKPPEELSPCTESGALSLESEISCLYPTSEFYS